MDVQGQINFIMLTERLHTLFLRYILSGRVRAPPEFELSDLIQTFQQGARTNRRALQSKFKSWARRMDIRNGNLILSSSGKIIIPQEKCDELVMVLHSEDHLHVDAVINQIQLKYTWSKKNFGMDRETVMRSIATNCKNVECRTEIERDLEKRIYGGLLFKGSSLPSLPTRFFQDAGVLNPMVFSPTTSPDWSLKFPAQRHFSHPCIIPQNIFSPKSIYDFKSSQFPHPTDNFQESNESRDLPNIRDKVLPQQPEKNEIIQTDKYQIMRCTADNKYEHVEYSLPSKQKSSVTKSCKKPRNIHEFTAMLKETENQSETYPSVLTDPKTKFLGTFGLAPKRLCSKKTLLRFKKERRKKRLLETQLWKYVGHKVLRDRNKMHKKCSYSQKKISPLHQYVKGCGKPSVGYSPIKNLKMSVGNVKGIEYSSAPVKVKTEPEVIDIASSDDDDTSCQIIKITKSDEDINQSHSDKWNNFNRWLNITPIFGANQTPQLLKPYQSIQNKPLDLLVHEKASKFQNAYNASIKTACRELPLQTDDDNLPEQKEQDTPCSIARPYLIPVASTSNAAVVHSPFYPVIRSFGTSSTSTDEFASSLRTLNPNLVNVKSLNIQGPRPMVFQPVPIRPRPSTESNGKNVKDSAAAYRVQRMAPGVKFVMVGGNPRGQVFVVPPQRPLVSQTVRPHVRDKKGKQLIAPRTRGPPSGQLEGAGSSSHQQVPNKESFSIKIKGKDSVETNIDLEMKKLTSWISRMKSSVTPTLFRRGVEKPVQKLIAQLNVGIHLVREVRRALIEVENNEKERNENIGLDENQSEPKITEALQEKSSRENNAVIDYTGRNGYKNLEKWIPVLQQFIFDMSEVQKTLKEHILTPEENLMNIFDVEVQNALFKEIGKPCPSFEPETTWMEKSSN